MVVEVQSSGQEQITAVVVVSVVSWVVALVESKKFKKSYSVYQ